MAYHSTVGHVEDWELKKGITDIIDIFGNPTVVWPMQEISGTVIHDESKNGYDLTADSDVSTWFDHSTRCNFLDFGAMFTRLYRPDASGHFSYGDGTTDSAFSVALCTNFDYEEPNVSFLVAKYRNDATIKTEWEIFVDNSTDIIFILDDMSASASIKVNALSAIPFGTFRTYVFTYDGSEGTDGMKIYENGVLMSTTPTTNGTYTAMEPTGVDLSVGANSNSNPTNRLDGRLSFLAIGPKELDADEAWNLNTIIRGLHGL